jgi:NAD(P)-dependent dehydrogenase (short-subunit alcohol dehydrogenase family)
MEGCDGWRAVSQMEGNTQTTMMNIIITGATGIAAATARLARDAGHRVFVISKGADECQALSETGYLMSRALVGVGSGTGRSMNARKKGGIR